MARVGALAVPPGLRIGYDTQGDREGSLKGDDDLDDAGDDAVINETFGGTRTSVSYEHAGKLIDDGQFVYVYDSWDRMLRVGSANDADVVIQTAEYDGTGRRRQEVVSNSGAREKTGIYLYEEGWRIAQINDGSGNTVQLNCLYRVGQTNYFILDDTQTLKRAKKMAAVGKLYHHAERRHATGHVGRQTQCAQGRKDAENVLPLPPIRQRKQELRQMVWNGASRDVARVSH
ncbi:MAG: hypothetical protein HY763_12815 [Planctomycetes bacterium]|nr:hypothetical protein [Planctomycetota bacterium]